MTLQLSVEQPIAQSGQISDYAEIPVIECEPTHCRNCPYFESYSDRGRGICKLFDRVEFDHHTITQDCKNKIRSEAEAQPTPAKIAKIRKPFPWVSMLGMVASLGVVTAVSDNAIASSETHTPPPHKDQSPHRGTGRRELYQASAYASFQASVDADVAYVMALEAKHEADFNARHNSVIEVETTLRNGNSVYGVWHGTRMIGTFYRRISDGKWAADSTVKNIRSHFDTSELAKNAIVKAWEKSRRG